MAECLRSQLATSCFSKRSKSLTSSPKCFMAYSNTPAAASGCCSLLLMLGKQKEEVVTLNTLSGGRCGVTVGRWLTSTLGTVSCRYRERINALLPPESSAGRISSEE